MTLAAAEIKWPELELFRTSPPNPSRSDQNPNIQVITVIAQHGPGRPQKERQIRWQIDEVGTPNTRRTQLTKNRQKALGPKPGAKVIKPKKTKLVAKNRLIKVRAHDAESTLPDGGRNIRRA